MQNDMQSRISNLVLRRSATIGLFDRKRILRVKTCVLCYKIIFNGHKIMLSNPDFKTMFHRSEIKFMHNFFLHLVKNSQHKDKLKYNQMGIMNGAVHARHVQDFCEYHIIDAFV